MGSLDISSCTTNMRAGHGCAGDDVIVDAPGVLPVDGRCSHRRPSSKDVHTRGSDIRLHRFRNSWG